jgi:hypothetical protein
MKPRRPSGLRSLSEAAERHNDEAANTWVKAHVGADWDDPDQWPISATEGRFRELALTVDPDEVPHDEGHGHRVVHPLPAALPPGTPMCSHCGLEAVSHKTCRRRGRTFTDLCHRCYQYAYRTNRLPSVRINKRHRARIS